MQGPRIRAVTLALALALPPTASAQAPFWDYIALQAAPLIAGGGSSGRVTFDLLIEQTANLFPPPLVVVEWYTEGTAENGEKRFGYCVKGAPTPDYPAACGSGGHITGLWSPTVGITTTLPEPATMALLASGLAALAGASILRRRVRKLRA